MPDNKFQADQNESRQEVSPGNPFAAPPSTETKEGPKGKKISPDNPFLDEQSITTPDQAPLKISKEEWPDIPATQPGRGLDVPGAEPAQAEVDTSALQDLEIDPQTAERIKNTSDLQTKAKLAQDAGIPGEVIHKLTRGQAGTPPPAPTVEPTKPQDREAFREQFKRDPKPNEHTEGSSAVPGESAFEGMDPIAALQNAGYRWQRQLGGLMQQAGENIEGQRRQLAEHMPSPGMTEEERRQTIDEVAHGKISEGLSRMGEKIFQDATLDLKANQTDAPEGSAGYYFNKAIESGIGSVLPAFVTTAVTKSPATGMALMGGQVSGETYAQDRLEGRSQDEANAHAAFNAATEAFSERLPFAVALERGGSFLGKTLGTGAAEGVTEVVNQAAQIAYEANQFDGVDSWEEVKEMPWGKVSQQLIDSGIIGALVGAPMGAAGYALGDRGPQQQDADQDIDQDGTATDVPPEEAPEFAGGPEQAEVERQAEQIKAEADQRRAELDQLADADLTAQADALGVATEGKDRKQIINSVLLAERGRPEAAQQDVSPENPFLDFPQVDTGMAAPATPATPSATPDTTATPEAGPGTDKTASVKMMVTKADKEALRQRGYPEDQIKKMRPEDVEAALADRPEATPDQDLVGSNMEDTEKANALKQAKQDKDLERQGARGDVEIDEGEGGPDLFAPDTQQGMFDQPQATPATPAAPATPPQQAAPDAGVQAQHAGQTVTGSQQTPNTKKDPLLTAVRKLGGIQREDLGGEVDPESFKRDTRAFRKTGGDSLDGMARRLSEHGYPVKGPDDLVQAINQEQKGYPTYAPQAYEDQQQEDPRQEIDDETYEAQHGGLLDTEAETEIDSEQDIPFEQRSQYTPSIQKARRQVDTEPSEAQKQAGNYRKGHFRPIPGVEIGVENPKGSTRSGVDRDGREWSVRLQDDYGYIKRTEAADGDQLDVFTGSRARRPNNPVFVVDQQDPNTGKFDEHKVMLGYKNRDEARKAYKRNYERGWKGLRGIRDFRNVREFRDWLKEADLKRPASAVEQQGKRKPTEAPESTEPSYTVQQDGEQYSLDFSKPMPDEVQVFTAPKAKPVVPKKSVRQRASRVRTGTLHTGKTAVSSPEDVAHLTAPLRKEAQENMVAVVTDDKGNVLSVIRHSLGETAAAPFQPVVLEGAVHDVPGAREVWLSHNHPSGRAQQSEADRKVTKRFGQNLAGTGVTFRGLLSVAPGGEYGFTGWQGYPKDLGDVAHEIPAHARQQEVPLEERKLRKVTKQDKKPKITSALEAREVMQSEVGDQEGVLLVDQQNRPAGFLPMTPKEMARLRTGQTGTGASKLLKALHEVNATGMFVRTMDTSVSNALENMAKFAQNHNVVFLDAFHGPSFVSSAQNGAMPKTDAPYLAHQAPGFYRQMEHELANRLPNSGTPEQFKETVQSWAKKGVFKREELAWSGLSEWLDERAAEGAQKINKAEVQDYLANNHITIEESLYGPTPGGDPVNFLELTNGEVAAWVEDGGQEAMVRIAPDQNGSWTVASYGQTFDALEDAKTWVRANFRGTGAQQTQYGEHTLPGGENYRELTFVLPRDTTQYEPPHFGGEPNVLAHVRFKDRKDADGSPMLFLEEVQSDWHQAAREQGYKEDGGAMPDAPFKQNGWAGLAIKRMIRWAAEHGYSSIGWTTGRTQGFRNGQIHNWSTVRIRESGGGMAPPDSFSRPRLEAEDGNGATVFSQPVSTDELADYVGEDVARQLLEQTPATVERAGIANLSAQVTGLDMEVGGKGMQAFYDEILPNTVKKYTKKWKARPERSTVEIPKDAAPKRYEGPTFSLERIGRIAREEEPLPSGKYATREELGLDDWEAISDVAGGMAKRGDFAAAMSQHGTSSLAQELGGEMVAETTVEAWRLPVTDQMRDSAMEGQPLFQDWPGRTPATNPGGLTPEQAAEAVRPVAENWRGGPGFETVARVQDLPFRLAHPIQTRGFEAGTQGVFDPVTGRVYLVARNIPDAQRAQEVLLHETVGHYGIRSVLGTELDSYMDQVAADHPAAVDAAARSHGLSTANPGDRRRAAEEALAEMVEAGSTPSVLDRIVGALRNGLRALGFNLQLSDQDLRALVGRAYRYVRGAPDTGRLADAWERATDPWHRDTKASWAALRHHNPHEAREAEALVGDALQANLRPDKAYKEQHRARALKRRLERARKRGDRDEVAAIEAEQRRNQRKFREYGPLRGRYQQLSPQAQATVRQALEQAGTDPLLATGTAGDPRDNPALQSMGQKIGRPKRSWWQRVLGMKHGLSHEMRQGGLDRFYGLTYAERIKEEREGVSLSAEDSSYIAARMSTTPDAQMRVLLKHGPLMWKGQMAQVVPNRKGLLEILDPVSHDMDLFEQYLAGRRAARLWMEGRERLFTPEEIEEAVALGRQFPEFEQAAREWYDFNHQMLNFAEGAGLIDPEGRKLWEHMDYVPFYRIHEYTGTVGGPQSSSSLTNQQSPIRHLSGGTSNVNSIVENMMQNTAHLLTASMRNHAAKKAVDNLKDYPDFMTPAKPSFEQAPVPMEQLKKQFARDGYDPDMWPEEAWEGMRMLYHWTPPKEPHIQRVYRDGKPEYWEIHDPYVARAMGGLHEEPFSGWMKAFTVPTQILRWSVTRNPEFMLRNFLRDTGQAHVLSRDKMTPVLSGLKGALQAHEDNPDMVKMWASGGGFYGGYLHAQDPEALSHTTQQLLKSHKAGKIQYANPLKAASDALFSASVRAENANRLAYFQAAKRSGKTDLEAAFEAKDLMDFSKRGDNGVVRFLSASVPFLNARIQGLDRLGRYAHNHPASFLMKGSTIALASIALWGMNKDDERYQALPMWQRQMYWHIFAGDQHFVIPKPFEVGVLFANAPQRIAETTAMTLQGEVGRGVEMATEAFWWDISSTLNFGTVEVGGWPVPAPQAVVPLAEQMANRSFFTDRPIVPRGKEGLLPEAQYSPWTSETLRSIGQATGMSPTRVEALFRGYMGPVGMYALGAADVFTRHMADYPHPPSMSWSDMPILGTLSRGDGPLRNTRYEKEFYEIFSQADAVMETAREYKDQGMPRSQRSLISRHRDEAMAYDFVQDTYQQAQERNQKIQEIYRHPEMPADDKKRRVRQLNEEKNRIFEQATKRLRRMGYK